VACDVIYCESAKHEAWHGGMAAAKNGVAKNNDGISGACQQHVTRATASWQRHRRAAARNSSISGMA